MGLPKFFWTPIALAKLAFSHVIINRAKTPLQVNMPFPSCFEPQYASGGYVQRFYYKISFHSHKTNFHNKNFALSLAVIMRFKVQSNLKHAKAWLKAVSG